MQDVHVFRIAFPHRIAFERTSVITEPLVVAPRIEIEVAFGNIQPVGFEYFPLAHPFDNAPGLAEIRKSIFVEIIFGEQAVGQRLISGCEGSRRKRQKSEKQHTFFERRIIHSNLLIIDSGQIYEKFVTAMYRIRASFLFREHGTRDCPANVRRAVPSEKIKLQL